MNRDFVRTTIAQTYQAVAGVADFTIYRFAYGSHINLTGTLTANRTITLDTTQLVDGDKFTFWRSGGDTGGPWTWTIGSTTLAQNTGCEFIWNASGAAWVRMR